MTTGHPLLGPAESGPAREPERLRHETELSRIEESLRGIRTTLEALRLEAKRKSFGEEDDEEPRGEGGQR